MSAIKFSNDASSLLAASITDVEVVVQVGATDGALFPNPGVGEYFPLALQNSAGDLEICYCTSRAGDLLTVTRAQEGTVAQAWTNGATRCELRLTAGVMNSLLQKTGDVMSGDLNMDGNELQDARITGDTVLVGGQLVGTAIRGTEDIATNEIVVPGDGTRATAGGSRLIVEADDVMTLLPIGTIFMWYGSLGALPDGWQNCDGTNGSPDLRDAFPRGAGGSFLLGATGGSAFASGNTDAGGAHGHTGAADAHALTLAEMPTHHHALRGSSGGGIGASGSIPGGFGLLSDFTGGHAIGAYYENAAVNGLPWAEDTGGGGGHSHTVTVDAAASHTHGVSAVTIIPPYKAVYFIMKVA